MLINGVETIQGGPKRDSAWSRNSPDYNGLAFGMKPACVKARVVRKSRGQQCPYGFDSRPKHLIPLGRNSERDFCFVLWFSTDAGYLSIRCKSMCSSHPILQHAAQSRQSEPFGVARAACVELSAIVYADNDAVLTDYTNNLKIDSTTGGICHFRQLRRARCGELNP